MRSLCEKIASGTNLKILRLEGFHDLSEVRQSTLQRMLTQLEELELGRWKRSPTLLALKIATSETSNLRKLTLGIDLKSVDSKVEDLKLDYEAKVEEKQMRSPCHWAN